MVDPSASGDVVTRNHGRSTSFLIILFSALKLGETGWILPGSRPVALEPGPGGPVLVFNTRVKWNQVQGVARPARHGRMVLEGTRQLQANLDLGPD